MKFDDVYYKTWTVICCVVLAAYVWAIFKLVAIS